MKSEPPLIFGINAILEKLKASPKDITEILVSGAAAARALQTEAARLGIRMAHVQSSLLDRLTTGQRHQGAVARVAPFRYESWEGLLDPAATSPQRLLVLDGITDPRNFGALLRSADGAGIAHVVISKDRSVGVTPTVIKASAGAAHHSRIYRVTNLCRALDDLKQRGYWVVGLEGGAARSIYDHNYSERLAIVLGSEGQGMRRLVRERCDFLISIPMAGKVTSLNVAVAGAVFLYELLRQDRYVDKRQTKR
jgi:23S rRNA (guanosine2251-2'-O)-methyltransferase